MDNTAKTRIHWVDTLKCLCILAVMVEHSAPMTNNMDAFIAPFFLNGFSFAAGYVYVNRPGFGTLMKKKLKQLLIPCYIFSLFIILTSYLLSFSGGHDNLLRDILLSFLQIRFNGDQMWYIAALFVCFIPFYFFIRAYESSSMSVKRKNAVFLLIAFVLNALSLAFVFYVPWGYLPWCRPDAPAALPWHLEYVFQAMFFMFAGYLFRHCWEDFFRRFDGALTALVLMVLYVLLIFAPSIFNFRFSYFGSYLVSFPRAILGVGAFLMLSRCLPATRYFDFLGQSTIAYYGLHGKVFSVLGIIAARFLPQLWDRVLFGEELYHVLGGIVLALIASVILIIPTMIINRFFPFAVGRPSRKN